MKVLYSPYTLRPRKKANRLSSMAPREGVLLKGVLKDKVLFADYFPHIALGDRSLDEFLPEFKFQNHEYDRKVFDLLLRDENFQRLKAKTFFNHQLWSPSDEIRAKVIKYKIQHNEDLSFLPLLRKGIRVRLDANGLFQRDEFLKYLKEIQDLSLIEYIEDPLSDQNWEGLPLPCAVDFIKGSPSSCVIYKPNCEFLPQNAEKIIYSSYLGGNLGKWHSYCELVQLGDLKETHGIVTDGFYEEEIPFLKGSFEQGFVADTTLGRKVYQECANREWKQLCSM